MVAARPTAGSGRAASAWVVARVAGRVVADAVRVVEGRVAEARVEGGAAGGATCAAAANARPTTTATPIQVEFVCFIADIKTARSCGRLPHHCTSSAPIALSFSTACQVTPT
jgi:hypothetical protein